MSDNQIPHIHVCFSPANHDHTAIYLNTHTNIFSQLRTKARTLHFRVNIQLASVHFRVNIQLASGHFRVNIQLASGHFRVNIQLASGHLCYFIESFLKNSMLLPYKRNIGQYKVIIYKSLCIYCTAYLSNKTENCNKHISSTLSL